MTAESVSKRPVLRFIVAVLFLFSLSLHRLKYCKMLILYIVEQFLAEIGSVLRITDTPAAVSSLCVGIMTNGGERKLVNLHE